MYVCLKFQGSSVYCCTKLLSALPTRIPRYTIFDGCLRACSNSRSSYNGDSVAGFINIVARCVLTRVLRLNSSASLSNGHRLVKGTL